MAITVDWGSRVIHIPKDYLELLSGTLYRLDTDQFRLDLKALEESETGSVFPDTHKHTTEYVIAGTTYSRAIEIINGYQVQFEDGAYSVNLFGSNNNVFDIGNGVLIQNQVQVIPSNSAGLQTVYSGSGLDAAQDAKLTQAAVASANASVLTALSNVVAAIFTDTDETLPDLISGIAAGSGLTAEQTRAALGMASANLDSQLLANKNKIDETVIRMDLDGSHQNTYTVDGDGVLLTIENDLYTLTRTVNGNGTISMVRVDK